VPGQIEDYGLIGDLHTAALVGRDGSIDWLCLPRFDSPACFAALLHDERAGHWSLAPARASSCTRRRYRGHSLVLETEWETPDGTVRLVDLMPPRGQAADVVRVVEGISGRVPMHMELVLRFDYGSVPPWVRLIDGQHCAIAGPDAVWLRSELPVEYTQRRLEARFEVQAGQRVPFVLTYTPSHAPKPRVVDGLAAVTGTERFWTEWIGRCDYRGGWGDEVRRSLVTLKALTYAPTGGVVAAATTSLPEQLGGSRNWDYRFCWLRDATFTLQALVGTGYVEEAKAWRDWLLRAAAGDPADLRIMYGLDGSRRIPEYTLDWLNGYEGSSPVRAGNAAAGQYQLDTWGRYWMGCTWPATPGWARQKTPGICSWPCWSSSKITGGTPTTACGRCAARASLSSTPRSWLGPESTAPCRPWHGSAFPAPCSAGGSCARRSTPTCAPAGTTRSGAPSRSSTARRVWMPPCC
jgi:GH15 family glucan-1,4-alpha-glucosidase